MKRKDERNGTSECKNPFAAMNLTPGPTTLAVDYSLVDRHGITASFLATAELQSSPSDRNDDTEVASSTSEIQCSFEV